MFGVIRLGCRHSAAAPHLCNDYEQHVISLRAKPQVHSPSLSDIRACVCVGVYNRVCVCVHCREFNLSSAHPKTSKQAALERHEQQQQQQDINLRPHACSSGRGRSQSVGKQRATGEQRLEQLARPKTAHWDKCECMCVLRRLLHPVVHNGMTLLT